MAKNNRLNRALSTINPLFRDSVKEMMENQTSSSKAYRFSQELPLRLVFFVGINKASREIISTVYKSNERDYYECYLNSKHRNSPIIQALPILERESVHRFLGILEHCEKTNQYLVIEKIIATINRSLLNFAKNEHELSTRKFISRLKLTETADNDLILDEITTLTIDSCLAFLAKIKKKQFVLDSELFDLIYISWLNVVSNALFDWDLAFSTYQENIINLVEELGLSMEELDKCQTFSNFSELMLLKAIDKGEGSRIWEMSQAWKFATTSINDGGLNTWVIESRTPFSIDVFKKVLIIFKSYSGYSGVTYRDLGLLLVIEMLKHCYGEAADLYLQQAKDERFMYLKEQEQLISERQLELARIERESTARESELRNIIHNLKQEAKESQRSMKQHLGQKQAELTALRSSNAELKAQLVEQSAIIEQQATLLVVQQQVEESSFTLDEQVNFLTKQKLALFGGISNAQLLELLPDLRVFQERNKSIDSIKQMDAVFVNTSFFNHAFFYKVKSELRGLDIPVYYVSGTNAQRIIAMMHSQLTN